MLTVVTTFVLHDDYSTGLRSMVLMKFEFLLGPFVRTNVPLNDLLIGELLDFSTLTCSTLAKTWFRFADWAYVWGRQSLARSTPLVSIILDSLIEKFFFFFFNRLSSIELQTQVRSLLPEVCQLIT